ncbi:PAS domain S-box protein [Algisphaera agarilytica]|uniref:histidine kinase n=1 Tax=Algisphaera agarilytica TaxID=1385975 RepID=A0A7X0LKJ0_9BACT|nr:PAS domain S-box protein [Algisphaera agarilytica]MBB6429003.1 PAS domain S-box-containing protein [Algisphaera agarilytica]
MTRSIPTAGVIDALPSAALILDDQGVILAVNRAWIKAADDCFGLVRKAEAGVNLFEALNSSCSNGCVDTEALTGGMRDVVGGQCDEFVQHYSCGAAEHHETRWVRIELRAYHESDGQRRVLLTRHDVTAEFRTDRALLESESRYHAVVEDQVDFICRYLPDTTLTFVNQSYCDYLGKTREELLGRKFLDFVPREEWPAVFNKINSFTPDFHTATDEHSALLPGGSMGWQSWTDRAFFNQHGEIIELQSVGRDITPIKRTQEALHESQTRFNQLADHLDGVFWIFDWKKRDIIYLSPAFEKVFAKPAQVVLDDSTQWIQSVHPKDQPHVMKVFRAADDEPFDLTYRIIRPTGEERWVRDRGYPVHDDDGNVVRLVGLVEDVTERVLSDQKVMRSEERYRAASEAGMDAFFLFDALRGEDGEIIDFVFTDLNQRGAEMVSRQRHEVIGQRLCELLPVNRSDFFFGAYREVVRTGEGFSREFPLDAAEEGIQAGWMEQQVVRVGDGVAISARDITSRKRNEQEIARQREENQKILDGIPAFVFYKDTQNRILRVNKTVCDAEGLPADQIEGRHSAELYPETADAFYKDDLEVIRSGQPKLGYVERMPTLDGKERWIRTDKVPLFDNDRKPVGVIVIAMDVTELKQTSEKLTASERRYRELFERVPVGVIEHDLTAVGRAFDELRELDVADLSAHMASNPEFIGEVMRKTRILSVNQGACALFASTGTEQFAEAVRQGRFRPPLEALLLKLHMIWDGQTSGEIETRYRTLDGRMIDVLLRVVIPESNGKPDLSRVLLSLTDISANRQRVFAQAQVTHAERERRMLGHELHDTLAQQLTGINMLSESLRRRLESQSIPEAERVAELAGMVGQANSEVRRLISGLSSERIAPDELETALESLAERSALVHQLPVTFHCRRTPDELDEEAANHLLFIAQEATHNAAKHAQASSIEIILGQSDDALTLTVKDDGVGIPPVPERSSGPESGLGLNIMRYRAEAIGATMTINSYPDAGTMIVCSRPSQTLHLPAGAPPRPQDETGEDYVI